MDTTLTSPDPLVSLRLLAVLEVLGSRLTATRHAPSVTRPLAIMVRRAIDTAHLEQFLRKVNPGIAELIRQHPDCFAGHVAHIANRIVEDPSIVVRGAAAIDRECIRLAEGVAGTLTAPAIRREYLTTHRAPRADRMILAAIWLLDEKDATSADQDLFLQVLDPCRDDPAIQPDAT
jgi:hypothetical protein